MAGAAVGLGSVVDGRGMVAVRGQEASCGGSACLVEAGSKYGVAVSGMSEATKGACERAEEVKIPRGKEVRGDSWGRGVGGLGPVVVD